MCSGTIDEVQDQAIAPTRQLVAMEPEFMNNFTPSTLQEKTAIKKALNSGGSSSLRTTARLPVVEAGKVIYGPMAAIRCRGRSP